MTRRAYHVALLLGVVLVASATVGIAIHIQRRFDIPDLIRDATMGRGGFIGACPFGDPDFDKLAREHEAVSPQLTSRLRRRFPAGSDERQLIQFLIAVGFEQEGNCDTDKTIRYVSINRSTNFISEMNASVYWKVDSRQKIVWIKGFVSFISL
jgi:hypothetical protein